MTAALVLAAAPLGPAEAGPCSAVKGAAAIGTDLCYQGALVASYQAPLADVGTGAYGGTTFITFDLGGTRVALLSEEGGPWSNPVPAGHGLESRSQGRADQEPGPEDRFVLAHLATPMVSAWQQALTEAGYTLHAYLPTNWFLVGTAEGGGQLASFPFVDRLRALSPDLKLDIQLPAPVGQEVVVNALSVPNAPGAYHAMIEAIEALDGQLLVTAPEVDRATVRLPAEALGSLATTPEVLWLEEGSTVLETDMDKIRVMTGVQAVEQAPEGIDGTGVIGMVMDSGIDAGHLDFQDSLLAINGPWVTASHGTATFGIVFGTGDGYTPATGMAPEADGVFAWWLSKSRYAQAQDLATIWEGVFQSHSWGIDVPKNNQYGTVSVEMDRIALELGVLPLQSMSNCGPQCARQEAMAKNILSVGGIYHKDTAPLADDEWDGTFSQASTGPAADGRTKPELTGPYDHIFTTSPGGYTLSFGGTSGATPVVAGAVALAHQMADEGVFPTLGDQPSPAAIKALLIGSAQTYLPHQLKQLSLFAVANEPWERDIQGWGLPALETLYEAGPGSLVLDEELGLATGQAFTTTYTPPADASEVRISLVWTDVPGSPSAAKALVNDLDLEVRDAEGTLVFQGNRGLDEGPLSVPATGLELQGVDRLNNVENVFLPGPAVLPGPWTIQVHGASVNMDADPTTAAVDQPFALSVLPIHD